MVYRTLSRLKWTGQLKDAEVIILHRGAPGDRKIINGSDITEVKRSYFYCIDSAGGRAEETFIPLHRVMEIRYKGKTLFTRKPKASAGRITG